MTRAAASTVDGLTLRQPTPEEFADLFALTRSVFLGDVRDEDCEADSWVFEYDRGIGIYAADGPGARQQPVATAAAYSRDLTVPGGPLPVAGVTWVAVAPTHRRRGLLTRMMRHQLSELHERGGEPVAALWAAEAAIYGRYGYGPAASQVELAARTKATGLRPDVDRGDGAITLVEPQSVVARLGEVYDAARRERVGFLDRRDRWWDVRLYHPEHARGGESALRCAMHEDRTGHADGYVIYTVKPTWTDGEPDGQVNIRELVATSPAAYAALFALLLEMDLVRTVRWWCAAIDEPVSHLVTSATAVRRSVFESLWIRLVDVDRALAARCYAAPIDVVLQVADPFCPWNEGSYRLAGDRTGAACERTADRDPDLVLSAATLGAAYLGGPTLAELAAAGLVQERRRGALAAASQAFGSRGRQPAALEVF